MGKRGTLLEDICAHVLSMGAESVQVEHRDKREWVFAATAGTAIGIANFASSSSDGKELLANLYAAARKPVRAVLGGHVRILRCTVHENFGEDAFTVRIDAAPGLDPSVAPRFTAKQGQYLAFIHHYTKIHRQAPAEADLQRYYEVTPPSIHQMVQTLERNGLIEKTPGQARSIRLLISPEHLPPLD